MFTVYMATNRTNGKRYIGVTGLGMSRRRDKHLENARRGRHGRFYDAIRKHGPNSFDWSVLCRRKGRAEAYRREFAYVDGLAPKYNVVPGGGGGDGGSNRQPVVCLEDGATFPSAAAAAIHYKADLSDVCKAVRNGRRVASDLHFQLADKPWSEGQRAARIAEIDEVFVAARRRVSVHKNAHPEIVEGRDVTGRRAAGPMAAARKVMCLDDSKIFDSASSAARFYGISKSGLIGVCLGQQFRQTAGGRRFKYAEVSADG